MAEVESRAHVPEGWYPDPNNSAINRWWSGSAWTAEVSPRDAAQAAARTVTTQSAAVRSVAVASRADATPRRVATPAAPSRASSRSRRVPEVVQPAYAFTRTMSTFALIAVVICLGLIAGLLLH